MMNRNFNRGRKFMFFIPVAVLIALALGYLVMFLWNQILPEVTHTGKLSYWQGLGLLVLCRILFGNFGPGNHGRFARRGNRMRAKWQNMSDEERDKFKQAYRERFRQRGCRIPKI